MDRILIEGILVRCIIGVNVDERREKQDVVISLEISADLSQACKSDRLEDSINYRDIKKKVMKLAEESNFFLVERLAQAVADVCLEDPRVLWVKVRVDKPAALRFAKTVGVEITRER